MAAGGVPPRRGWFYDRTNSRLAARYNNTNFMTGTATAVTFPLAATFSAAIGGTSASFSSTVAGASTFTALNAAAATAGGAAAFLATTTAGGLGVYVGSGAPTVAAAKGSLYLRTDGSGTGDRAYINTNGSTTWTALTTAA